MQLAFYSFKNTSQTKPGLSFNSGFSECFFGWRNLLLLVPKIYMNLSALGYRYIRHCSLNTSQIIFNVLNMARGGSFITWNTFLFSVQAFFLTEIGPVPWNRVNKLLSCSFLFHLSRFLCEGDIRITSERPKISFLSLVSVRINLLPFKHIEIAHKRSHECFLVKSSCELKLSCLLNHSC